MRTLRFDLAALTVLAMFVGAPAHEGFRASLLAQEHNHAAETTDKATAVPGQGMMAAMAAKDAKLGDMVKAMNAAKGEAKVDAMAALLTALVEDHQAMHASMGKGMADGAMKDKMQMKGGMPAPKADTTAPKK